MSYARFGVDGSAVYVYYDVGGFYNCCGCCLDGHSFHAKTKKEIVEHLRTHRLHGHCVPQYVFDELESEKGVE